MSGGFGLQFSSYPFMTTGSAHGHEPMIFLSRLFYRNTPQLCCGVRRRSFDPSLLRDVLFDLGYEDLLMKSSHSNYYLLIAYRSHE
jgi:hypothetical protein